MGPGAAPQRHLILLLVVALVASVSWQNGTDSSSMQLAEADAEGPRTGRFNQLFFRAEPATPTSVLYPSDWYLTYDPVVRWPSRATPHIIFALSSMANFYVANSCRESIRQLLPDQAAVVAVEAGPGWNHNDWEKCRGGEGITFTKKIINTRGRTVLLVTALGPQAPARLRNTAEQIASEIEPMEFR